MASPNGGWETVQRRRRYPAQLNMVKPYVPYYRRPSYAQVVHPTSNPASPRANHPNLAPNSRPNSPVTPKNTYYYVSPHSPTELRFPPSSQYPEWRGRCFKCCRTGHSVANCRNQRRCGKCWEYGHIGSNCTKQVKPVAAEIPLVVTKCEPGFEELLADPRPYPPLLMPEGRPQKVHCFIERDDDYFIELEKLLKSVVVHNMGFQSDLSVENIADYSVRTGLVEKSEIQVSALPGTRFLIHLPDRVDAQTFIRATPAEAWEEGLSFQLWTPLDEATIVVPRFKILLELIGVHVLLWRERNVIKAVSQFGVYLGSLEQEVHNSVKSWMVAVGTDDLAKIPQTIAMHVGGMEFTVAVRPIIWKRSVLYNAEDFPPRPEKFKGPSVHNEDEIIPMSKAMLRELCKGKHPNELPPEYRQFASPSEQGVHHQEGQQHEVIGKNLSVGEAGQTHPQTEHATQRQHEHSHSHRKLSFHKGSTSNNSNEEKSKVSRVSCTPGMQTGNHNLGIHGEMNDFQGNHNMPQKGIDVIVNKESQKGAKINADFSKTRAEVSPVLLRRGEVSKNMSGNEGTQFTKEIQRINGEHTLNVAVNAPMQKGKEILQHSRIERDSNLDITKANKEADVNKEGGQSVSQNSSTAVTLKEFKFMAKKKKISRAQDPGPSRPARPIQKYKRIAAGSTLKPLKPAGQTKWVPLPLNNKPPKRAQIQLNAEGYFEVRINHDHMDNLAKGCGFKTDEVQAIIDVDNAKRIEKQKEMEEEEQEIPELDSDMEEALSRFELDQSDEEALARFEAEEAMNLEDEN